MQNYSDAVPDPWSQGIPYKNGLWANYSITNYAGSLLSLYLLCEIARSRNCKIGEIFIGGLLFGCITMSIPCATQCLLNWVADENRFTYGVMACNIEAYFHVSAICFQFFSVALIAWSYHNTIISSFTKQIQITRKQALFILFVCLVLSYIITYIIGLYSNIILLPTGTYCFYAFTSPVMLYWFDPMLCIATFQIMYWYRKIYIYSKNALITDKRNQIRSLAGTVIMFIIVLVVGWGSALVATIITLAKGMTPEMCDAFTGVLGSLHSVLVPLIYGYKSRRLSFPCNKAKSRNAIYHDNMMIFVIRPSIIRDNFVISPVSGTPRSIQHNTLSPRADDSRTKKSRLVRPQTPRYPIIHS
jgi:hypothetical protein